MIVGSGIGAEAIGPGEGPRQAWQDAGMIRLSVLYPRTEGATFDHDYYRDEHVPLCIDAWGLDPGQAQIDKGFDGPYEAAVHFTFDDVAAIGEAMGQPRTGEVMADVANYTTITPVMQTSEIVQ
jgi:uncharacterized protein (TIGR02118 family)